MLSLNNINLTAFINKGTVLVYSILDFLRADFSTSTFLITTQKSLHPLREIAQPVCVVEMKKEIAKTGRVITVL